MHFKRGSTIGEAATTMEAAGSMAAALEGSQCSKRRRNGIGGEGGISSCLECRNRRRRRVVLEARIARSEGDAGGLREGLLRRPTEELDVPKLPESEREREGMPDSSDNGDQESDFDLQESTAERDSHRTSPTEAELEGFFVAVEGDLRRRFADRYNFDVANDAPFAGRFEWIRLTQEAE